MSECMPNCNPIPQRVDEHLQYLSPQGKFNFIYVGGFNLRDVGVILSVGLQLSSPENELSDALGTYLEPTTTMSLSSFRDSWHPSQNVKRYSNTAPL